MFTGAVTSHLTARELSGLVRDVADLHHVRVGTVRDAVAAGQVDAMVYDKPILAWLVRQDHPNELQVLGLNLDPLAMRSLFPLAARCAGSLISRWRTPRAPPGGAR
jgi:hypothetical protein